MAVRLRTGIAWNLVAAACTQGSVFATNVVVANLFGRQVFGEYAMLQSTLVTLAAVAQLSTGYTATKYVAEFRHSDPERAGRVLGLCSRFAVGAGGMTAVALLLAAPWIAGPVLRAPHLSGALIFVAAAVLFGTVNGYQIGALAGLEAFQRLGRAGMVNGLVLFSFATIGALEGGVSGAVAGLAGSAAVQWLVLRHLLSAELARQGLVVRPCSLGEETRIITRFALPATLSGLVSTPVVWLTSLWLARQPGGYDQVALLSVAHNIRTMVLFLPVVMGGVGASILNSERGAGAEERYRRAFWVNVGLTAATVAIGAVVIGGLSPWVLGAFGSAFRDGYLVVLVLLLAVVPEALAMAVYQAILSEGRLWLSFWAIVAPRDLTVLVIAYVLAPGWGALGVSTAHTFAWTAALVAYVAAAWHVRPSIFLQAGASPAKGSR